VSSRRGRLGLDVVGRSGNIELGGGTLKKTVKIIPQVPEPSTWMLFAAGLVATACARWRRTAAGNNQGIVPA